MKKFKEAKGKVIRKADGGDLPYEEGPALFRLVEGIRSDMAKDIVSPREAAARAKRMGLAAAGPKVQPLKNLSQFASPGLASLVDRSGRPFAAPGSRYGAGVSGADLAGSSIAKALAPVGKGVSALSDEQGPAAPSSRAGSIGRSSRKAPMPTERASVPTYLDRDMDFMSKMTQADPELMKTIAMGLPSLPGSAPKGEGEGEDSELASMMAASGKGKSGFKKFMKDYGKFIALGAMAGAGGKAGQIAAPIMAALPGLIEMLKGKKSSKSSGAPKSSVQTGMAHGGSVGKKSSGGEPPKKSEGGAIRKFKGGSMKGNSMDSMLTPKYAKGGKTDKMDKMGKAAGEMPQHKKMAMGKPTPQSTGQKFAKGGAAKYASGGACKGYGISKKIRPTGPMN